MRVLYLKTLPKTKKPDLGSIGDRVFPDPVEFRLTRSSLLVNSYAEYITALHTPLVGIILIGEPEGSVSRLDLLYRLATDKVLPEDKELWLYGVSNPAEIGIYSACFSGYFNSKLTTAFCETAYQYAVYGARFSRIDGVLARLPENEEYVDSLGIEQMRTFHYNVGIVSEFVNGALPKGYEAQISAILTKGV